MVLFEYKDNVLEERKRYKVGARIHRISHAFSNVFAAVEYDSCCVCWKYRRKWILCSLTTVKIVWRSFLKARIRIIIYYDFNGFQFPR